MIIKKETETHTVPESSCLAVVPLPRIVGTDVPVVLITYAGLTKVSGIVSFGVMFHVFCPWNTAIAEEISHRYVRRNVKNTHTHIQSCNSIIVVYFIWLVC